MTLKEFLANTDNYRIIDDLCKKKFSDSGEALECSNYILDKLKEDRGRRVTEFKGRSSFKTYITVTVNALIVDFCRMKYGRARYPKRIRDAGESAVKAYELLVFQDMSEDYAFSYLKENGLIKGRKSAFLEMINRLEIYKKADRARIFPMSSVSKQILNRFIITDSQNPLEKILSREESIQKEKLTELIQEFVEALSGEDRMILKLSWQEGLSLRKIAKILEMTPYETGKRRNEIEHSFRELLKKNGFQFHEQKAVGVVLILCVQGSVVLVRVLVLLVNI